MTNGEKPLTKQDLLEVLGAMEQRFDAKLNTLEKRVREHVHDTETALLKAFHKYSVTNELRFKDLETFHFTASQRLTELEAAERLSALELKIAEIERKLDRRQ